MKLKFFYTALAVALFASCEKTEIREVEKEGSGNASGELVLNFDSRFASEDFQLAKKYPYQLNNQHGTFDLEYEFERLRYWVSNVKLVKASGEEVIIPNSYYLIEETGEIAVPHLVQGEKYPANKREVVEIKNIESGEYKAIKFSIGVEPKYNDNITLTSGELGVLNGMGFSDGWMWFTSYIFQKLDGKVHWAASTDRDQSGNLITSKNIRWDSGSNELFVGAEKTIEFTEPVKIDGSHGGKVNMEVDVKQLLSATDTPWADNIISQSKKDLMIAFRNAMLEKSLSLKGVETLSAAN